ncbi:MAG TPA: 4Fe-4S dicluster domain-containing protein [Bacteroidales bacterium]|nr:4Fe-4S dicluster domain-containing protein [Bacteroidales bacterium]
MKLLLDMTKLRSALVEDSGLKLPEGCFYQSLNADGLKTIRELATFRFTCRRCEDAPCISVCPAEALEKDEDGIISRYTNLCISCKSCVTICPFGTMMTDFFKHHRNKDLFYDLTDKKELELFINACPAGTVSVVEYDESPDQNIYKLNDQILIRDYLYTTVKQ